MTTYEEISICEKCNFNFWTQEARFSLALYRQNKADYGTGHPYTVIHKKAFRSKIKSRRLQEYLSH